MFIRKSDGTKCWNLNHVVSFDVVESGSLYDVSVTLTTGGAGTAVGGFATAALASAAVAHVANAVQGDAAEALLLQSQDGLKTVNVAATDGLTVSGSGTNWWVGVLTQGTILATATSQVDAIAALDAIANRYGVVSF